MHNKKGVVYLAVKKPIPKLVTTVSILTRRLREGKTYNDFRKAWFHTTGFGVEGDDSEEGSNRMYTLINIFDPQEVIVLGFATSTLKQLDDALNIDVKVRGENPLDEVIEPEIGRSFCALVAEDDSGAVGYIPYCPPMIDRKETDMQVFEKTRLALLSIFAAASQKWDAVNEARKKNSYSIKKQQFSLTLFFGIRARPRRFIIPALR